MLLRYHYKHHYHTSEHCCVLKPKSTPVEVPDLLNVILKQVIDALEVLCGQVRQLAAPVFCQLHCCTRDVMRFSEWNTCSSKDWLSTPGCLYAILQRYQSLDCCCCNMEAARRYCAGNCLMCSVCQCVLQALRGTTHAVTHILQPYDKELLMSLETVIH